MTPTNGIEYYANKVTGLICCGFDFNIIDIGFA